jgi:anhydro-N-acetylmuramic acid kinase
LSREKYFVGLMSGTSMDGIDAALMQWKQAAPVLIDTFSHPWPDSIRTQLSRLVGSTHCTLQELGELDIRCGQQFASATLQLLGKARITASEVTAIGSHGQTLFHHPHGDAPFSTQIGDPNTIAQQTGITTIADFRRRDMAAGGQGAPLVPAFHEAIFHQHEYDRVILNIGGIANISILPADGRVSGFDTGPGNCLMDRWIQKNLGDDYDENGQWASRGTVHQPLLGRLLADDYFSHEPPKSTGTEYFSRPWLDSQLKDFLQVESVDIQATLLQFTIKSIGNAIQQWAPHTREVLVCGGGVHNTNLMDSLALQLGQINLGSTMDSKPAIDPDWVEAMAFAWLAMRTLQHQPGNIPSVTGAAKEVVLGGIYPGSQGR